MWGRAVVMSWSMGWAERGGVLVMGHNGGDHSPWSVAVQPVHVNIAALVVQPHFGVALTIKVMIVENVNPVWRCQHRTIQKWEGVGGDDEGQCRGPIEECLLLLPGVGKDVLIGGPLAV
eukprot:12005641-Ditylum_brightwellii.AAC.1